MNKTGRTVVLWIAAALGVLAMPVAAESGAGEGAAAEAPSACFDERGVVLADSVLDPENAARTAPPKPKQRTLPALRQRGDKCPSGSEVAPRAIIRGNGELCAIDVDASRGCSRFAEELKKMAKQWRFEPATIEGKPVAVSFVMKLKR